MYEPLIRPGRSNVLNFCAGAVISACGRANHVDLALQFCEEMRRERLEISEHIWSTLIDAYARAGKYVIY